MRASLFYIVILSASLVVLNSHARGSKTWEEIKASGELVMGIDGESPPFNFFEGKEPKGFEVELGKAIAKELKLKPVFKSGAFKGMIVGLQTGVYDFILTHHAKKPEREQQVHFARPYLCSGATWYSLSPDLNDAASIRGKTAVYPVGMIYGKQIENFAQGVKLKTVNSELEGFQFLAAKKADIWVTDKFIGLYVSKSRRDIKMFQGPLIEKDTLGLLLPKADAADGKLPEWTRIFESTYQKIINSGLYKKLSIEHLGENALCP